MGETTAISWCDHTFNPWIGCAKVSPACDGCYAEALMDTRYGRAEWGGPGKGAGTRARTSPGYWRQPVRWNKAAAASGARPFVFCASLADVFDNEAPPAWRQDLLELVAATPALVWLLLTKRPQNIVDMVDDAGGLPPNVALGATAEDQQRWDLNVGHLIAAKFALSPVFAFVSCEPLLGSIDPRRAKMPRALRKRVFLPPDVPVFDPLLPITDRRMRVDWIITGGETDQGSHKARPSHPAWFGEFRDACAATGTPYHHKHNGEWAIASEANGHFNHIMTESDAVWVHADGVVTSPSWMREDVPSDQARDPVAMFRAGRARAGRTLDGEIHDARPEIASCRP